MTRNTGDALDIQNPLGGNSLPSLLPIGDGRGLDPQPVGQLPLGADNLDGTLQSAQLEGRAVGIRGFVHVPYIRHNLKLIQQGNPNRCSCIVLQMRKTPDPKADQGFSLRLQELLKTCDIPRRGAGAYLQKKYSVSNVVANAWLNGEYKPKIDVARKIAADHKGNFDILYFGKKSATEWPFAFDIERYNRLTPGQRVRAEAALLGTIIDMEGGFDGDTKSRTADRARR